MNKPVEHLITQHLDIWTQATEAKSTAGRGTRGKINLLGIQKLRELILEMAVRGLLVPQDRNDEPASELLKKIAAEKAQLINDGKIKKSKPLPDISDDEKPFDLPKGWEWVRLGFLSKKLTDGSHNPPKDAGKGFPMLSSQNVVDGFIDYQNPSRYISPEEFDKEDARTQIKSGDVLLTIVASLGRSAVVGLNPPKFTLQRSVAVIDTSLNSHYLSKLLISPVCKDYFDKHAKGTAQKGIYLGKLSLMELPVPPLAEQTRIVAKVDELMALCDALEAQTLDSMATHQTLVETLLASLVQSAPSRSHVPRGNADPALTTSTNIGSHAQHGNQTVGLRNNQAWSLIEQYFDALFTTDHSIDTLKQTILQLAVMGKLVPQDPSDEPASELLKKITAEKAQLIKDGKIKKSKPLPPITDDEKPFDLPNGWEWVRLNDIYSLENGDRGKNYPNKSLLVDSGIPFVNAGHLENGQVNQGEMTFISQERFDLLKAGKFTSGDILYCLRGSLGKCALVTGIEVGAIASSLVILKPFKCSNQAYLMQFLNSVFALNQIKHYDNGTAQPNLSATDLAKFLVPIAPLAEQTRIVAKVNELMTLCDQIKTQLQTAQYTQAQLAQTITQKALA